MSAADDWNQRIIEEFRANGGKVGGQFEGAPLLLLHSTGARSGRVRTNPMMYQADGDRFVVFASKAGADTNPDWYHNLRAHPQATVEVGTETHQVEARVAEGAERERLWTKQKADYPGFADYESKTARMIPVIVLERTMSSAIRRLMMSAVIQDLISAVTAIDADEFADRELGDLVINTERLLNAVHALSATALEVFQRRGNWAAEGSMSAASWAAARTGSSTWSLRARVRQGAGLQRLPSACLPARVGQLSPQHLDALAACARRHLDRAKLDEAMLVDQAGWLDADSFGVVARQWEEHAAAVEAPDPTTVTTLEPVDELHLSRTFDGRYQLDGSFSAATGQLVYAALDAEVDRQLRAGRDGDPSVAPAASQVRAAALVDLLTQTMRRDPSEQSVPDRYRVAVVVQHDTNGELPIAGCDSPAFRVVLNAQSEVLDVGRLTQKWPSGIRRAITHRDADVCSLVVTDQLHGVMFTIANRGRAAAEPVSTTGRCCVEDTIRSSTNRDGKSRSKRARP